MAIVRSAVQSVELFHLAFLGVLQVRLHQDNYILKGGANLRFFFDSPRYSEDMDFDVLGIGRWKLEERVDEVLNSTALIQTIRTQGLAVTEVSKPKQTDTTQRWKAALALQNRREQFWTKIEFSRRPSLQDSQLDQVRKEIAEKYALRPPTVRHYLEGAMIVQKIMALSTRAETQARDIFDLDLLFRRHPERVVLNERVRGLVDLAVHRVLELPFEAYRRQVVEFLEPDLAELHDSEQSWNEMQKNVIDRVEQLR